jgi:hypothetical protein
VFGISRYDRIAKALNIERHLTWSELLPFFEGAAEELGPCSPSSLSSPWIGRYIRSGG